MSNRGGFRGVGRGRARIAAVGVILDGSGSAIGTGLRGGIEIPYDCLIESLAVRATDGNTGSLVLDLWRLSASENDAGVTPSSAYSIVSQSKPTLVTTNRYSDKTLAGWINHLYAGDWLFYNVDSVSGLTRITISLQLRRYLV